MTNTVPQELIETALAAAEAARLVTTKYFRTSLDSTHKSDNSPVTIADCETEQRIKEVILQRHPQHSLQGEESGATDTNSEWCWVIDPIDGTKSFVTGNPTFGTLIALLRAGRPVLGLIDHAILNERWLGVAGRATTHNGTPCSTNACTALAAASLYATTIDMFSGQSWQQFERLSNAVRTRLFGGDCYSYGLLASGYTEIVCEAAMQVHDYLAVVPVVQGAGGMITDWHGNPLTMSAANTNPNPNPDGQVLATANAALHQVALAALHSANNPT